MPNNKTPQDLSIIEKSIMSASVEEDPFFSGKKSRMTSTLLSNYVLSISLLKNIARHFTNPADF